MDSLKKEELFAKVSSPENLDPLVEQTFSDDDKDGSGYIEKEEYALICQQIAKGLKLPLPTQNEIDNGLKNLDKNNDGKLCEEEFKQLIKLLLKAIVNKV